MDFNLINVGIAELNIGSTPDILRTILGSCVGICLYDPTNKIGGLSHIMLPTKIFKSSSERKYADSAIPILLSELEDKKAKRSNIIAKIVGGSTMFNIGKSSILGEIGKNNIDKVKEILDFHNIKIVSEDVGGNYGRTIDFYTETGEVKIKSIDKEEKVI